MAKICTMIGHLGCASHAQINVMKIPAIKTFVFRTDVKVTHFVVERFYGKLLLIKMHSSTALSKVLMICMTIYSSQAS